MLNCLGKEELEMLVAALDSISRWQDFSREELLDMAGLTSRYWACYLLQRTDPDRPGRNVYIG